MKISNILILLALVGCSPRHKSEGLSANDGCDIPKLTWMEVHEGFDEKRMLDLAKRLEVDAKVNAKIIGSATNNVSLGFDLKTIQEIVGSKKVAVSQEFFEKTTAYRTNVCAIESWLKKGLISDPEIRIEAQRQLLGLSGDFGIIAAGLDKRLKKIEVQLAPVSLPERIRRLMRELDPRILPTLEQKDMKISGSFSSYQVGELTKLANERGAEKYLMLIRDEVSGITFGDGEVKTMAVFMLYQRLLTDSLPR